jgi:hypothetical protein
VYDLVIETNEMKETFLITWAKSFLSECKDHSKKKKKEKRKIGNVIDNIEAYNAHIHTQFREVVWR